MIFEEMLREEKQEGRLETARSDVLELLEELGEIPDRLRDRIKVLEDPEQLKFLLKLAAKADSMQEFEARAEQYLHAE